MTRRTIIYIIGLVLLGACQRTAPKGTDPFLLEFVMPEEFGGSVYYASQRVYLNGSVDYEYVTDVMGMVNVESVVPGIYDIVTGMCPSRTTPA